MNESVYVAKKDPLPTAEYLILQNQKFTLWSCFRDVCAPEIMQIQNHHDSFTLIEIIQSNVQKKVC